MNSMSIFYNSISTLFGCLSDEKMTIDERVEVYNFISERLYEFLNINHPVLNVQLIDSDKLKDNDYNPNIVASPELKLLVHSISSDGLTLPIVSGKNTSGESVIIDGFHRTKVIKETAAIKESLHGYIPIVSLDKNKEDRMASTVRHNMARGAHQVELTSTLVKKLKLAHWEDKNIATELGMDFDEILRMKQVTGLAELFSEHEFSTAWK